jgi:perosamine synthetase
MIPYSRQTIDDDDIQAVADALRSDWLTTGPQVDAFEQAFAAQVSARYAVAVSSGTAGLHLACLAANIGPGSECITSPITFAATANAALYCGSRPVFADVCPDTVNIDPVQVEKLLSPCTRALLPVHFAGHACDMDALGEIARRRHLTVIEDACHALGAITPDGTVGNCRHSDMTVFSTHAVKAIATGEGGMVTTNSPELNERLRLLRSHGITRDPDRLLDNEGGWHYEMQELGFNYRIADAACALGHSQLKKLNGFIARRRSIAAQYDRAFASLPGICVPVERSGHQSAYHLYVIRFAGATSALRREAFDRLRAAGLGVNVHYIPVYRQPYYRDTLGYAQDTCACAEAYYREAVSIPLYPSMTDAQVQTVIAAVQRVAC